MTLIRPLSGVIPPMVTPLRADQTLDTEGAARLVEHIVGGGIHGLFLLGTTGEAPDIRYDVRRELVERVCRQVAGRVPVLVGITDTVFEEGMLLARTAMDAGAAAVVAAPPYYFAPGQPEILEYYTLLAERSPLPVFIYNMPSHTKVSIDVKTVVELSRHPNIAGVKDSSANIVYFNSLRHALRDRKDFSILIGPEEAMCEAVLMGANGGVAGGANIFPRLFADAYSAAAARDMEKVREFQERIMSISSALYGVGHHMSSFVKGVKCALNLMGICSDELAAPLERFRAREREIIRGRLVGLGVPLP